MKQDDTVKILEKNVRDLQSQLVECHKRVAELNDMVNKLHKLNTEQQAQLSYYKNESI